MRNMKRLMSLVISICLLILPACNGKKNKTNTTGRYIESEITPPVEGHFTSFVNDDGIIICIDEGLTTRYESYDNGITWSESSFLKDETKTLDNIQYITLLDDGRLLVFQFDEGLFIISTDGECQRYSVPEIDKAISENDGISVSLLTSLSDDLFIIRYTTGGMFTQAVKGGVPLNGNDNNDTFASGDNEVPDDLDTRNGPIQEPNTSSGTHEATTGGGMMMVPMNAKTLLIDINSKTVVADMVVEDVSAATATDSNFYLMDSNGKVTVYNLLDGSKSNKKEIKFKDEKEPKEGVMTSIHFMSFGGNLLTHDNDGNLYAAQDKNIMFSDSSGKVDTLIISFDFSIGVQNCILNSIHVLNDRSIIVNSSEFDQINKPNRLYKYTWHEDMSFDDDKTITVWSLEDNGLVRATITELRKKYPDAQITYEVALTGSSTMSVDDAIKTLNTQLLSNSGPDVIILDGCYAQNYINKGMLRDLSDIIDTNDIFSNLLKPYITDSKIYCIPTQFLAPVLIGNADYLQKIQSLDDLVAQVVDGNDLPITESSSNNASPGRPFSDIEEKDRAALYFPDLTALFEILWLTSAPEIIADNKLNTEALERYISSVKAISDKYSLTEISQDPGAMGLALSNGNSVVEVPGSLVRYTMHMTHYGAFFAGNLQMLQIMLERDDSLLIPFPGLSSGTWQPTTMVGISIDSKKVSFAAEFIKVMLSNEVQNINHGTGFPVTKDGFNSQIEEINRRNAEFGLDRMEFDLSVLIDKLNTPSMPDILLVDMMWNSVEKCCKGQIDVKGAVSEIEQNVKKYLAERA